MSERPSIPASGFRATPQLRVLVAEPSAAAREWLAPIVRKVGGHMVEVETGLELQLALTRSSYDLVFTHARLSAPSGLQVLASARAAGSTVPFIVSTSFHQGSMRVFVSDQEGTVLSSRVLNAEQLTLLMEGLLRGAKGAAQLG